MDSISLFLLKGPCSLYLLTRLMITTCPPALSPSPHSTLLKESMTASVPSQFGAHNISFAKHLPHTQVEPHNLVISNVCVLYVCGQDLIGPMADKVLPILYDAQHIAAGSHRFLLNTRARHKTK